MLVIQRLRPLRRLPLAMVLGLALMAVGGAFDVAVHVAAVPAAHEAHRAGASDHTGHLVAIAGMVLVLVGVVAHGARRQSRPRAATHGGLDGHAHR